MGLDMYLRGSKHTQYNDTRTEDGFKVDTLILELGYWRKHPNLHGYIVQTFAEGKDECQQIPLDEGALEQIISAVEAEVLPPTTGFFFGKSDGTEKARDIEIFKKALEWLKGPGDGYRSIYYQASW